MNNLDNPNMGIMIGLRNIVSVKLDDAPPRWEYLLFYDKDDATTDEINAIIEYLDIPTFNMSYIIYRTRGGIHVIGLTPLNSDNWGFLFDQLQRLVPEYYSGETIRLSRKKGEVQSLVYSNINYPYVLKLTMMFKKRFPDIVINPNVKPLDKHMAVFEKYWSYKI